jgi:hypothetical protein
MISFYVTRIRLGKLVIEDVPTRWREAVRAALAEEE